MTRVPRETVLVGALLAVAAATCFAATPQTDKTLVAWAAPANLTQRGGSILTIQTGQEFDAIVFGEKAPRRWMAGSDHFRRTQDDQADYPAETADAGTLVQIAIVYDGNAIRLYRNGQPYADYRAENVHFLGIDNHIALFGLRHIGAGTGKPFAGTVEDARIYARALTQAQIAALKPNEPSAIQPLAWWDFEGDTVVDRAGRFAHSATTGGVKVADGRLVLDGKGYLAAARSKADARMATRKGAPRVPGAPYVPETPAWPEPPPDDWVTFHLAHPGPGQARPGDPNCAFDYKGRTHLHYIYRNRTGFVFAHVSSDDRVRWTWHTTVLAPPTTGHGMFSGTGFYTKDGTPAIIYHGQGSGRNWIQYGLDDNLDKWSKPEVMLPRDRSGSLMENERYFDPDIWINNEVYYGVNGRSSREPATIMKSDNLKDWTFIGELLHPDFDEQTLGVKKGEDISCPNMFTLGDKWVLVCISHRLGCRYFIGDFKDEQYLPEFHAMMSFGGNRFFAPESMQTRDGRRVMWAWLRHDGLRPTGVQALPRELELGDDGVLRIRPLRELTSLRHAEKDWNQVTVKDGAERALDGLTGDAVEIEATFRAPLPEACGLHLLADADGRGGLRIVAGADRDTLRAGEVEAPFEVKPNEDLTLRVFVDKNLVEVFANDRQAVVVAHAPRRPNPNVRLFAKGRDATARVKGWRMKSIYTNP